MNAALALQAAMIAALRADMDLAALTPGGIHDGAPQNAGVPHVALAELATMRFDTDSDDGEEHFATFHVWSRDGGRRQALEIVAAIVAALDDTPLALDGHHLVSLRAEGADARREADGRTWRGRVRLRAVTEPG